MGLWKNLSGIIGNVLQLNFTGPKMIGSSTNIITIKDKDDNDGKLISANANHKNLEIYDGILHKTTISMISGGIENLSFILPNNAGNPGNFLSTNGNGSLSWIDNPKIYTLNYDSPATKILLPAASNRYIDKVLIKITTLFDATGVLIDIGQTGNVDLYVDQTEIDLTATGKYNINVAHYEPLAKDVLLTFTAGSGGTQGIAIIAIFYSIPGIIT